MVRCCHDGNRRQNNANEQAEWQLPKPQRSSPITPGKAWRSLLPIDPLTLLRASVTLLIMRSSSLQYAELNYGHEDSQRPLLHPASSCLVLLTHGRPVFDLRFGHRYSSRYLRTTALFTHKAFHNAVFKRMETDDRKATTGASTLSELLAPALSPPVHCSPKCAPARKVRVAGCLNLSFTGIAAAITSASSLVRVIGSMRLRSTMARQCVCRSALRQRF